MMAVIVVGVCLFLLGVICGCLAGAAGRPVPTPPLEQLTDTIRRLGAEKAYSAGLRATLADQRLEVGRLRAVLDLAPPERLRLLGEHFGLTMFQVAHILETKTTTPHPGGKANSPTVEAAS